MDHRDELRELGYKQQPGMRGLKYAHVLDAIQILNRSIQKITEKTVVNCWVHSQILSRKQIKKCCNSIGQKHPDFSKLEHSPGLEAESISLARPYRSTKIEEIQRDFDEDEVDMSIYPYTNDSTTEGEDVMSEAESITQMIQSFTINDHQNPADYADMKHQVTQWLKDLSLQEESIYKNTGRDPSSLLQYLNDLKEEQEAKLQRIDEEERRKEEEEKEAAQNMPFKTEQYRSACDTVKWLEQVLVEAERMKVSDTVRAHLINTLRSAFIERKSLAPTKKQKTTLDFFGIK